MGRSLEGSGGVPVKFLPQHFSVRTEVKQPEASVRTAGAPSEFQTENLPNTDLDCYSVPSCSVNHRQLHWIIYIGIVIRVSIGSIGQFW